MLQDVLNAQNLLAIVDPMMEAAGRRGPAGSGVLSPMLRSCPNLQGLKVGLIAVAKAAARWSLTDQFNTANCCADTHSDFRDQGYKSGISSSGGDTLASRFPNSDS